MNPNIHRDVQYKATTLPTRTKPTISVENKNPLKGTTAGQSKGFLPKADHDLNAA
ncbi:MAG: hypothetical protein ACUVXA_08940 [Candidatus Jordarchaeum sp.]|uniref:hypothetical protein n=1 Tax=Candidatus Jordarchaeum sp. TaxID=2823881 RepID=UPI004049D26B